MLRRKMEQGREVEKLGIIAVLNRVAREGLTKQMVFGQISEGFEGVNPVDTRGKSIPDRRTHKCKGFAFCQ